MLKHGEKIVRKSSIPIILFILITFSSFNFPACLSHCNDYFDVLEFYAEENPLNPNGVTKLHIVLDWAYGRPIRVTSNWRDGYAGLMPDYPDSNNAYEIVFLGGEGEKRSSYYTIYYRAPPDPGRDILIIVFEDDSDRECKDKQLLMRTY